MSDAETRGALAHDVGKYVARIARNVPVSGPIPAPLIPLLAKDLYELPGGKRASERFAELAADGEPSSAREALREIDALEPRVRAADQDACVRACALARQVERTLRAHAGATE